MAENIKLTPEVEINDEVQYLIRMDGEALGSVSDEDRAILIIDSLVASEVKRLSNQWTKVLREDLKGGREVTLSTQSIGHLYNGSVIKVSTFDLVKVPTLYLIKPRNSLPKRSSPIPIPPPLPPPMFDIQEGIRKARIRACSLPDYDFEVGSSSESEESGDDSDSDY